MGYTLNFAAVWRSFDQLLEGLLLSLGLAFISILIGAAIGLVVAFALIAKSCWLKRPAAAYVTIIRNLPILVLVLFAYFALPQMGVRLGKIQSFVVVLSIYSGAYLAEVFRAGLLSIPTGIDGGRACNRPDADADPHLDHCAADAAQCAALAVLDGDLAVQGYLACGRDRGSGTHLRSAQDQCRDLPGHRDMDRCFGSLCRHLFRARRADALCRAPACRSEVTI